MTAPANASWRDLPIDDGEFLNLALSIDERNFLDVDLRYRLEKIYPSLMTEALDTYALHDPFAEHGPGRALADLLGVAAADVTCAAGTTSLLEAIATLAQGGLYAWGLSYPDLPYWGARCGAPARPFMPDDVTHVPPESVVLLDRPRMRDGEPLRDEIVAVAETLAERNSVLVADESYGNYYPPAWSLGTATSTVPGLVVLRGVSKGLWMGSLRVGAAVSSSSVTERIRAAVPPMQVSAVQAALAAEVWGAGDITSRLRARISVIRPEFEQALSDAGLTPLPNLAGMPVLLLEDEPAVAHRLLKGRGVLGKRQVLWDPILGRNTEHCRLSVPLAEDRVRAAIDRLGAPGRADGSGSSAL